ncbi:MAG: GGDEF domain-containing protein [Burkholderiales bacterium]|nr:GGDEF domain-containing protein [Burkholderiales bacterium]MDE1928401.1 GGDEF domain-containing protein [Burkholderiales bacterium]MDE2158301.1 GGDEF domain-containing protein [Burkholderiales bacterium]MDE2504162.1 GGDEF domain-containing protein [Burkholderiales bacterium]
MWETSTIHLQQGSATLLQAIRGAGAGEACLIVYSGEDIGRRYAVEGPCMVIGRTHEADARLDSPGISRRHAELRRQGEQVLLRDLGSANGTFVNEVRLDAAVALKEGDLIRVGDVILRFYGRQSLDALLHDRIYRMATVDEGTGLHTKKYLLDALQREIDLARRIGRPLAVMGLDLDHFKSVNDRYGHNAGDEVLRLAASAVRDTVRACDIVGRVGGEEFAVVLPATELGAAVELAERVRVAVAARAHDLVVPGEERVETRRQTVSIGVARWSAEMTQARELLGAADTLLYAAKRGGRDRVTA